MPRVIGPADRYEASVDGANATASHFDKAQVVGVRVRRPRTPVIDRFEVDLQDVSLDRPTKQVTRIGAARAVVRVKATDLTAYLSQQSWIAQPSVRLSSPDGVIISGLFKVPGVSLAATAPASFRGRLVPNGPQLLVAVDSLSSGEREAPALLRGLVAAAINPLFDLSAYAVPSTIDSIQVQDDAIVIQAAGTQLSVAAADPPPR